MQSERPMSAGRVTLYRNASSNQGVLRGGVRRLTRRSPSPLRRAQRSVAFAATQRGRSRHGRNGGNDGPGGAG